MVHYRTDPELRKFTVLNDGCCFFFCWFVCLFFFSSMVKDNDFQSMQNAKINYMMLVEVDNNFNYLLLCLQALSELAKSRLKDGLLAAI